MTTDASPTRPTRRRPAASAAAGSPAPGWAQRRSTSTRCSSRCSAWCGPTHPKADLRLIERAYDVAEQPPPRPAAQERRPVHHPPARRRHDPRRAGHERRRPCAPRCCTTRSRTPRTRSTQLRADFGDEIADAGRRRHQAGQGQVRRGGRRPRPSARWSSRWPATSGCWSSSSPTGCTTCARCATSRRSKQEQQGPRDAGDLRAAGAPARHEHHQVGAGGPRVRDALPQACTTRSSGWSPSARRAATSTSQDVIDQVSGDLRDGQDQGDGHRPAEALLLDLPEDDRPRPRLRRHLRPRRHPGARRHRPRLLRGARRDPRAMEPGARPVQGLHRDAQVQHVPVAAHDGDRPGGQAGRAADPHPRDAPPGRVRHRRALEVQGGRDGASGGRPGGAARPATTWPGCASCSTGRGRPPTRASSWSRCASTCRRSRGVRLHARRARSSRCPRARRRSTSRTPYTPRSGTARSAPGSTAAWCRWSRTLDNGDTVEIFTSKAPDAGPSRDWLDFVKSPPRPQQDPAVVLQGAPRGARSSRARTPSPGRCASRACRCSA